MGLVFLLAVLSIVENFEGIIGLPAYFFVFKSGVEAPFIVGVVITFVLPVLCVILGLIAFMKKSNLLYLVSLISLGLIVLLSWISSIVSYEDFSSYGDFRNDSRLLLGFSSFPLEYSSNSLLFDSFPSIVELSLLVSVFVAIILSALGLVSSRSANVSFNRSLFDFSFDNFIYVKVSKFLYIVSIILHGLVGLVALGFPIWNLAQPYPLLDPILSLFLLPLVFIGLFISLILIRLGLEAGVALIKIAENTKRR